jgi:lysophospholipase L1-like esterase
MGTVADHPAPSTATAPAAGTHPFLLGRPWLGETRWWAKLVVRAGVYAAALLILGLSTLARSFAITVFAAAVVAAAGIWFHRHSKPDDAGMRAAPGVKVFVFTLLIEIGIVVCAAQQWRVLGLWGFVGLTLITFGVGQLMAEIRGAARTVLLAVVGLLWVNALLLLGGSLVFGLGGLPMLLAGLLLLLPAIALSSERLVAVWVHFRGRTLGLIAAGGLAACALAAVLLRDVGGFRLGVVIVCVLALFVFMLASNTDADALVILFVVALVWSQLPRGDEPAKDFVDSASQHEILVLGDSYISGEGARSYLIGTNTRDPSQYDQCRRSVNAWAIQVQRDLQKTNPLQLDFFACSGATVDNVLAGGEGQYIGENPDHVYAAANGQTRHLLSQLELFGQQTRQATVDWVFVSIGGNDAGFGDLVQECLGPGDCSRDGQPWLDNLQTDVGPQVVTLYKELQTRFKDHVVVVPYPVGISDGPCSVFRSTFTSRERRFLAGFTTQLDAVLRQRAAEAGVHYLDDMVDVFAANHVRICDTDRANAAVNFIALNPVGGDTDPSVWLHNSMHPNERGHRLMAGVVERWMLQPTPAEDPRGVPAPTLSLTKIMADGVSYCDRTPGPVGCAAPVQRSLFDRVRDAVRDHGLGSLLLLFGALAAAAAFLARRRAIRQPEAQPFVPWPSRQIDKLGRVWRWVVAGGVLAAMVVFLSVILPAAAGVSGGYGAAQSKSGDALRALGQQRWRSYFVTTSHDLAWYIPAYLLVGVAVIVLVAWRQSRSSATAQPPATYETFDGLPPRAWWALGLVTLAAIADVVETVLFRLSLGRLVEHGPDAHLGVLPLVTRLMTVLKFGSGLAAAVLVVVLIVFRSPRPHEEQGAPDAMVAPLPDTPPPPEPVPAGVGE